jgi:hypothetical protein
MTAAKAGLPFGDDNKKGNGVVFSSSINDPALRSHRGTAEVH